MYRFVFSPRWLGALVAALLASAVMVSLGFWQLSRYEERSEINDRIDAVSSSAPVDQILPAPASGDPVGDTAPAASHWSTITVTGRYDPAHEVLVRGRTARGRVGFAVVTPLRRGDGTAVLVARGWVAPAPEGLTVLPTVPPPPDGEVSVQARVRPPESGAETVEWRDGVLQTRRIDPAALAPHLPYPVYGNYLQLPGSDDPGLTTLPVRRENAWLNAGYAVQWWIFAGMALVGFGWLVRREAHRMRETGPGPSPAAGKSTLGTLSPRGPDGGWTRTTGPDGGRTPTTGGAP